jgi:hypothetical protein
MLRKPPLGPLDMLKTTEGVVFGDCACFSAAVVRAEDCLSGKDSSGTSAVITVDSCAREASAMMIPMVDIFLGPNAYPTRIGRKCGCEAVLMVVNESSAVLFAARLSLSSSRG